MTRAPHDFSVDLQIYRLCSRCAQPDLVAVRRMPCRPLLPDEASRMIARKTAMAAKFRGRPSATERPVVNRQAPRRLGRS